MNKLAPMVCALLCLIVCGCGGGGGSNSPSVTPTTTNDFAGTWNGDWTDSTLDQKGSLHLFIDASGNVSGSSYNSTLKVTATVVGTISSQGTITATYTYPDALYTTSGTVAINDLGHMTGKLPGCLNGVQIGTTTLDLVHSP